jgi:tRNA A37 threonylcarbamoyladenosine synthetase subunit TsaC/SUA5/YrdC
VRVPDHPAARALLGALGEPLLSATAYLPGEPEPPTDAADIRASLEHELDLVIDAGSCGTEPTTVIDLTSDQPVVVRKGRGSLDALPGEFSVQTPQQA